MRKLQREIVTHAHVDTVFAHADAPKTDPDPLIAKLSASSGALVEARVGLESQLAADGAGGPRGADWLAQLRGHVAQTPDDPDALALEAEAECRSGHGTECLATAERVLARTPDHAGALTWKGVALTDQAIAGAAADRPARLAEARKTIERAIGIDNQAPAALIAYFQSFTKAGEAVPDSAMRAIATAIRIVPAAPGPRLYLAQEMVRRGQPDIARRILQPVLNGAYDTPEKKAAERLFASASGSVAAAP
jgi:tetratricopeptide (TPR) repeat protein